MLQNIWDFVIIIHMNIFGKIGYHFRNKTFLKKIDFYICYKLKFYKILYPIFCLFKINNKKVVCDNFKGRGFSCNPKYIVEELHRRFPEYKIIWIFDFYHLDPKTLPEYVIPVQYYTTKELFHLATSKFWIFNYRRYKQIPKRKDQIYFQTWHGSIGPKMIEADALETLDKDYLENAKIDSTKINYCISGSKHLTNIYKNSFWYNGPILEFGSPRNDILFDKTKYEIIKKQLGLESKKICLYAPTFRKDYLFDSYTLNYNQLNSFLKKYTSEDWITLVRFHPNIIFEELPQFQNNVVNVSDYPDSQELLLISDMLITDYSSIIYDYALLSRPAFIFAPDYEDYIKNDRNLYFKLSETPFPIAKTTEELINNIQNLNKTKFEKDINDFLLSKGALEDGNASKKTVDFLLNLT